MIFETSLQARILIPMAVSLGYGILFSTAVILILVPALFVMVENGRRNLKRARAWLAGIRPPVLQPSAYFNIAVNRPVADALGVSVPDETAFGLRVRRRLGGEP